MNDKELQHYLFQLFSPLISDFLAHQHSFDHRYNHKTWKFVPVYLNRFFDYYRDFLSGKRESVDRPGSLEVELLDLKDSLWNAQGHWEMIDDRDWNHEGDPCFFELLEDFFDFVLLPILLQRSLIQKLSSYDPTVVIGFINKVFIDEFSKYYEARLKVA